MVLHYVLVYYVSPISHMAEELNCTEKIFLILGEGVLVHSNGEFSALGIIDTIEANCECPVSLAWRRIFLSSTAKIFSAFFLRTLIGLYYFCSRLRL